MISAMPTVNPSITGSGHKRDEASGPDQTAGDQDDPGKQCREQQPVETVLLR